MCRRCIANKLCWAMRIWRRRSRRLWNAFFHQMSRQMQRIRIPCCQASMGCNKGRVSKVRRFGSQRARPHAPPPRHITYKLMVHQIFSLHTMLVSTVHYSLHYGDRLHLLRAGLYCACDCWSVLCWCMYWCNASGCSVKGFMCYFAHTIFTPVTWFVRQAIVCDEYFVPALTRMSHKLKVSEDVAG